jgi:hypothetical protein
MSPLLYIRVPFFIQQIDYKSFEEVKVLYCLAICNQINRACCVGAAVLANRVNRCQGIRAERYVRIVEPYHLQVLQYVIKHLQKTNKKINLP